jgi:hypothetical protein
MTTLIGSIVIEANDKERVTGADIRIYRWAEQWLSPDEARNLVYSLSKRHLIELVIAHQSAIEAIAIWP